MAFPFDERKSRVLAALCGDSPQDFSPKGGLDAPIEDLVNWVNAQPDWCTTSSCSGRITLYRHGPASDPRQSEPSVRAGGRGRRLTNGGRRHTMQARARAVEGRGVAVLLARSFEL